MPATLKDVIKKAHISLSIDPAQYAGRGNNTSDVNSKMLEGLYQTIKSDVNTMAANAFVDMVAALTARGDMSATTFVHALNILAASNWVYTSGRVPTRADALAKSASELLAAKDGMMHLKGLGFATLTAMQNTSHTPAADVSGEFLRAHGKSPDGRSARR